MPTLRFEDQPIPFKPGDTLATALYRAGVRVFTRSFKYHRPRGLYCLSGDCPNCFVNVDGIPGVRACMTPARECVVHREGGLPSTDRDVLAVLGRMHRLMPVGFYYKTFIKPRWAWPLVERVVQRVTGIGALPLRRSPDPRAARYVRANLLVVGAGPAGLAAAIAGARAGHSVMLCEERHIGEGIFDDTTRQCVEEFHSEALSLGVQVLERAPAIGIYEGPVVPIAKPDELLLVRAEKVVIATGAADRHQVFLGNDLPGVWQGRAAGALTAQHGLLPGRKAVVMAGSLEAPTLVETLRRAGVDLTVVIPEGYFDTAFPGVPTTLTGEISRAHGRRAVRAVTVVTAFGRVRLPCDALIISRALDPRDLLLRMSGTLTSVVGAGDVLRPGAGLDDVIASGSRALDGPTDSGPLTSDLPSPEAGIVCLCEDVSVDDLRRAIDEGFDSSELVKRYTTASMGPCQGAQCGRYVACIAAAHQSSGALSEAIPVRTTARPPARPIALEHLAGVTHENILRRTALHDTHCVSGARLGPSGAWIRPFNYGEPLEEYRAVRERVSIMDVSTLGKFLIVGPDAAPFVDHVFPCRTDDLVPGELRYVIFLDEAGYLADDGMLAALASGGFSLTTTSSGASHAGAWLELLAERRRDGVHIVDVSEVNGTILVAGPRSRELLRELTEDDIGPESFPYMTRREIVVAGVPCDVMRIGFVGELSFELHHPRDQSASLWKTLRDAGRRFDLLPHGLDALDVLRLEKGHVYIGQDTLPDDTPNKVGLGRLVSMEKGDFVGRSGLARIQALPQGRSLRGLRFGRDALPDELAGQPLWHDGQIVGRVTSCEYSPALDDVIGLGWVVGAQNRGAPLVAGDALVTISSTPFLDPEGRRVRG